MPIPDYQDFMLPLLQDIFDGLEHKIRDITEQLAGNCGLGGAHDLFDNLDRFSDGKAEYIRVATKGWREVAESAGR